MFVGSVSNAPDGSQCLIGWESDESLAPQANTLTMSRVGSQAANLSKTTNDTMLMFVSSELKNNLHRLSLIAGSVFEVSVGALRFRALERAPSVLWFCSLMTR